MRPSTIVTLITAGVVALVSIALAIFVFLDHDSGQFWFYWIAPILAFSFIMVVGMLSLGYARKVLLPRYRGRRVEE